jgi:hypothetical protein
MPTETPTWVCALAEAEAKPQAARATMTAIRFMRVFSRAIRGK